MESNKARLRSGLNGFFPNTYLDADKLISSHFVIE